MIRATVVRALVLTAVFAAALTPVTCLGGDSNQLPTRATKELPLLGRPSFQVQAYPFRLTPANLARHRTHPQLAFWKMLKIGNDHFEATHLEPRVDVCDRRYVFDAQPPPNSPLPLVFNPTGSCPAFVVNPKIARRALEKQRADEVESARLLKDDVPAAQIYSGLDGGRNADYVARFPGRLILAK